jgi:putative thioredoxin
MSKNPFAGLPNNKFGNAFDLSSLKAPAAGESTIAYGKEVTQANLVSDFVKESNNKVVILLCWSPRSAQAKEILEILGKLESADQNAWLLGTVNVDTQAAVAQALQVQSVPVAIAIIQEQMIPLFESVPPLDQVRLVINKLLELAAGKGIGKAPENSAIVETPMEPEEEAAYAAMEKGDYAVAKAAYQGWLKRKPNDPVATIGLAQADLMNRINGLDFALTLKNSKADDLTSQMMCADIEIAQGDYEAAFNRLITAVKSFTADDRDKAKAHLLQLFNLVDPADPRLVKARGQLASALF